MSARRDPTCKTLDTSFQLAHNASMAKLACIQATSQASTPALERNEGASRREAMIAALGGELLEGSGFEHEQPEPDFEEEEVS